MELTADTRRLAAVARGDVIVGPRLLAGRKGAVGQLRLYDWIGADFMGITPQMVAEALDGMKGAGELCVYINSPGGDAADGVTIYNCLCRFAGRRTTYVDGEAQSAAGLCFLAGDERVMMPGTQIMVHGPQAQLRGTPEEIEQSLAGLRTLRTSVAEIYQGRTGQSAETVAGWMASKAVWFDGPKALEAGLCTRVAETAEMAGEARMTLSAARTIPWRDMERIRRRSTR